MGQRKQPPDTNTVKALDTKAPDTDSTNPTSPVKPPRVTQPDNPTRFSRALRQARERVGIDSRAELARRSGCALSHMSRMERGHTAPSLKIIARLASALHAASDGGLGTEASIRMRLVSAAIDDAVTDARTFVAA